MGKIKDFCACCVSDWFLGQRSRMEVMFGGVGAIYFVYEERGFIIDPLIF